MAELNKILKERLSKIFEGETQGITAKKLNMTQGNVSKWMSGQQLPTTDMLYTISKTYKMSVDWLLGISDEPEVDGLVLEKLTYEQVAKIFDNLIENNTIEIPNKNGIYSSTKKGDDDEHTLPIYIWEHIKLKDRLLSEIMRRRYKLIDPELNMHDVWYDKLASFHGLHLLNYNEKLEKVIDANSPAQFNEGDWAELIEKLSKLNEDELEKMVSKINEKEGK